MQRIVLLLGLSTALTGCSEYVAIKSYPGGAKAYVDGQVIGTTPAYTYIPRSQVGLPHTWRVEFRNCDAAEGNLETGIAYPIADADIPFDSGQLGTQGAPTTGTVDWTVPADLPTGTYTYFCRIHPSMRGGFVVTEG